MRSEALIRLERIARGEIVPKSGVTGVTGVTRPSCYTAKTRVVTRVTLCYTLETGKAKNVTHFGNATARVTDDPSGRVRPGRTRGNRDRGLGKRAASLRGRMGGLPNREIRSTYPETEWYAGSGRCRTLPRRMGGPRARISAGSLADIFGRGLDWRGFAAANGYGRSGHTTR